MKKITAIFFLSFFPLGMHAQFSINYLAGYGKYDMSSLKDLSEMTYRTVAHSGMFPEGLKLVDNFPGYITHNVDLLYKIKAHEFGLKASFLTTGSKIAYADYSGKYEGKMIVNGYKAGLVYRRHFFRTRMSDACFLSFFGEVSPSAIFSSFKIKETLFVIWDDKHTDIPMEEVENINKTAFSVQPLVGARAELHNHFLFTLSAGYDFVFKGKMNNGARFNWSGFRVNAGIGYMF
jgi:hypothetical protein